MTAVESHDEQPTGRQFEHVRDIVHRTRLSRTHVYDVLRAGAVPTVTVGRTILVERGAFDAYLAEQSTGQRRSKS